MEDDEDDFYGGGGHGVKEEQQMEADEKDETMDVSEDGEDDDDSDHDVQFTLEKPDGAKAEPPPGSKAARQQARTTTSTAKEKKVKSGTPPVKSEPQRAGSAAPPTAVKGTLTHNGKEGKDFPEIRTSNIDVNATPTWPANGKPITALDIDAHLAEHSKPWRLPGTDQTDFFNYGFDEYTWVQYTIRQQSMSDTISQQRQEDAQMKALFGNGGGDNQGAGMMGGMPPGMQADPQMAKMAQDMGVPLEFVMQMMQQNGAMPGMGGGPGMAMGGPQGQFNQQGGDFGSGQNSVSPQPQAGQAFQPPQGPSGGAQQGQQGGFGNMEGFSPQQIAIMQQEQQGGGGGGHMGGGGGRGGRRRGRW